jgi:hypothetical protein
VRDDSASDRQYIPGGGWMVTWRHQDGSTTIEPIVAWSCDGGALGVGRALITDNEGVLSPLERDRGAGICVWHPDQEIIEADGTVKSGRYAYPEACPPGPVDQV